MKTPADVRAAYKAAPHLTHVELTWREGRIEHWLRFGRPVVDQRIDHCRRIASFEPGAVFAFVRWASNAYGTVVSRIDIVRVVGAGEAYQTLPFVRRGGDILLKLEGWPGVEKVLQSIDAIEAIGIAPAEVAPDHWRHVHNRLTAGAQPGDYSPAQHEAWLKRRRIQS